MITQEDEQTRKLDLVLRTGGVLMENGADTNRTMRTMKRVATWLGLPHKQLHIYIVYNMLMVNVSDSERSYTKFQRVERHVINLHVLEAISHLSLNALSGDYTPEVYEQELEMIIAKPRHYKTWQVAIGGGLACGGFCIQFGCDWVAFFFAAISAIIGLRLRMFLNEKGSNTYVNIALAAFVSTLIAWGLALFSQHVAAGVPALAFVHTVTPWHPLLACALFIVPGVPLINSVSDLLSGYTQVGMTRAANTFLIMVAMAFGIAFAIRVCGIDNFVHDLTMVPHHAYLEYMLAAAISAIGFSMIFNVPRRLLWVVAIGGIIAVCTRNFVNLGPSTHNMGLDFGLVIGSFVGSTIVSILVCTYVRRLQTPHQCVAIPSVIPMIPGVLMYRALFSFIDMHGIVGEVTIAMNNAIQASLIILCIALGVAIPNVFFRRLIYPPKITHCS